MRRFGILLPASLLAVLLAATPALACGGLIGPNGAVNLLRTTTLAGYHDGVEHYVTAFQFAGGGGGFGSITPLSGVPASGRKGRDRAPPPLLPATGPHHDPDRQPVGPAADPRPRQGGHRAGPG